MSASEKPDVSPVSGRSPEDIVAAVDASAKHLVSESGGCEVIWRMWGEGRPVVLLHGNFGSWTHWIRNIGALAARHLVLVPDLPGFGDSATPQEPHAIESIVNPLREGLAELDLLSKPLPVAGFSFGTTIAGALARDLGPEADRLVIVSAGQIKARRQKIAPFKPWRKAASDEERRAAHRTNLEIMMLGNPASADDLAVHLQGWNAARRRITTEPLTEHHPLREILFSLQCPVHGIWGARDATIGPYMQDRADLMAALGHGSRVAIIEDAGHWVQYEKPEAFNDALLRALPDEAPQPSPQ